MRKSLVLTAILGLAASALAAGVVYEIEFKEAGGAPQAREMAVEGSRLKMGVAHGGSARQGDMIYDGERNQVTMVDHGEKSFYVIDQAAVERIAGQMSGAMRQLEEALKNVPEGQRDQLRKMMEGRLPQQPERPLLEVRKTGETGERAGYPCVKYDLLRGGQKFQELWVTDWDNVEGSEEMRLLFQELAGFFSEMMDAFSSASGAFGGLAEGLANSMFEAMEEIDGFPVVTREFDGGELESESTLRSATRRSLDPTEFEPPAGYKRREMFPGG